MEKTYILKDAYINSTKENVEKLIAYLREIGHKPLSLKCRRQNVFKTSWSTRDINLINRCQIQNAREYLDFIKDDFKEKQLKIVLADLSNYVSDLDKNADTSFTCLSTNTLPSAIHYNTAKILFYEHQVSKGNQNNYSSDLLALYAIRLSLESRVRRFLGIDYSISKGKNIGLATLIKISKKLKEVEYSKKIRWDEIEWVNNWLNHHMHRHIRPYPWNIHQALEILKPFINPKEELIISERKIYSSNSATYVKDEKSFQIEIELYLKKLYPEVEIIWLNRREIVK